MTEPETISTAQSPAERQTSSRLVSFFDHHVPPLGAGNYRVEAAQIVSSKDPEKPVGIPADRFKVVRYNVASLAMLPTTGTAVIFVGLSQDQSCFRIFDANGVLAREATSIELQNRQEDLKPLIGRIQSLPEQGDGTTGADHKLARDISHLIGLRSSVRRNFTVGGERYSLNPQRVLSVFPPANSLGDHSNVLPHVMLDRATLPWERNATHDPGQTKLPDPPIPWMAILVFDNDPDSDAPVPKSIKLGSALPQAKADHDTLYQNKDVSYLPDQVIETEGSETADQPVTVIDVPWTQLEPILPKVEDLPYLSHVRTRSAGYNDAQGAERSVIIGNRLPGRGRQSIAFLISLEHRFEGNKFWLDDRLNTGAAQTIPVRLVVLKSWRFGCLDEASFMVTDKTLSSVKDQLTDAGQTWAEDECSGLIGQKFVPEGKFRDALGALKDPADADLLVKSSKSASLNFRSLLMSLDQGLLTMPTPQNTVLTPALKTALDQGNLPLTASLRNGTQSIAWYRSPLGAADHTDMTFEPHARAADHLLRFNDGLGMFDATYAAAWELGRLMMLASKSESVALYRWKRAHAHYLQANARLHHLPFSHLPDALDMPDALANWLYDTALLKGVPFDYLVPDPAMLPTESLRAFRVDPLWIECLLDGAFSIGRMNDNDITAEADQKAMHGGGPLELAINDLGSSWPKDGASGVLIRSDVIAGWPDLQVDALAYVTEKGTMSHGSTLAFFQKMLNRGGSLTDLSHSILSDIGLGLPRADHCLSHVVKRDEQENGIAWLLTDARGTDLAHISTSLNDSTRLEVSLPHLRHDRLSDNVLLCIFRGNADVFSAHLKPEAIHFGISEPDNVRHFERFKKLRRHDGVEVDDLALSELPFREATSKGRENVLDVAKLVKKMRTALKKAGLFTGSGPLTSGAFALQMVEGVDNVRFVSGSVSQKAQ